MIKKIVMAGIAIAALCMLSVPQAAAIPYLTETYNGVFFRNYEVFVDNNYQYNGDDFLAQANGPIGPTIDVGDTFWGVLYSQEILAPVDPSGQVGPTLWQAGGSMGPPVEITGYFATDVIQVIPAAVFGTPSDVIVLGPALVDPNGILAQGEVLRIYEDGVQNFNPTTQNLGLTTATDGTHVWSLGMGASTDGDSANGYWYSFAPILIPATGPVGVSYAGLNFMTPPATGGQLFTAIDDPNETFVGFGANPLVEMWFNSEIFVLNPITSTTLFHFGSNDPAVFYPVPEPASMLLLGSGLIGLAGLGRRRMLRKKD